MIRLLVILVFAGASLTSAQVNAPVRNLVSGEYFWDADPGVGNGVAVNFVDGTADETLESVLQSGVAVPSSSGAHRFTLRVKDSDGNWSETFHTMVFIAPDTPVMAPGMNLVVAEYFWDADPGQGNGQLMMSLDGLIDETVEAVFESTVTTPSQPGPHTFHVRVRDDDGTWSALFQTVVHVSAGGFVEPRSMAVVMAEYFWDADPGEGNGTAMMAAKGSLDETLEAVLGAGVAVPSTQGAHLFSVRVQGFDGIWSRAFSTVVHIEPPPPDIGIVTAEYFWDVDPGEGNGTSLMAQDGAFDESLETLVNSAALTPPSSGPHRFSVRVQGVDGIWGPLFTTLVDQASGSHVAARSMGLLAAEYFWDVDPGEGSATPLVASDGSFDETFETILGSGIATPASTGPHLLNVRVRDADGTWTPAFATVVELSSSVPSSPRAMAVAAAEYFWNTDPGHGNGTAFPAVDGAFDEVLEGLVEASVPVPAAPGPQILFVRTQDVAGDWSDTFATVVHTANPTGPVPNRRLVQAEYFWDVDPGQGNGLALFAADGSLDEVLETVYRNGLPTPGSFGPHTFNVRVRDADGTWGPLFKTVVRLVIGNNGVGYVYDKDDDGDTLENLLESFLGTDPSSFTDASNHLSWDLKPVAGSGEDKHLTVRVDRNHVDPDSVLEVQLSPNLMDWYGESDGWVSQTLDSAATLEFQSTNPIDSLERLFFRFLVHPTTP